MLAAALIVPFKLLKLALPRNAIIVAVALALTAVLALWLSLHNQGYRVLRFVTLVPVVIAFSLLLRGTAPIIDVLQSARPVQSAIAALGEVPTVAVYDVPRSVEYGLALLSQSASFPATNAMKFLLAIIWLWPPLEARLNCSTVCPDASSPASAASPGSISTFI